MKYNPMLLTDFYKISHRIMSEEGTGMIYSTFTPRMSRIKEIDKVVFFGLKGFIKEYLIDYFNENFFKRGKDQVIIEYKRMITYTLGADAADASHIEALWELGYLPLEIKALPELTEVPLKVPMFTIQNTNPKFYWLTNFLETLMSAELWKVTTAATISKYYKDICDVAADRTCDDRSHVMWQCHNFSYRGMSGNDDAIKTGAAHLQFFKGTDTIPSIMYLEQYYGVNVEKELVGASVPATEHSIQCGYGDDEKYIRRMILDVIPNGIVSVVVDGYDYWNVITDIMPRLKKEIMNRDGKVVLRPDSGEPADIICGDVNARTLYEQKGTIELLWEIFGGTINSKGYKVLDSHIGLIYGDAITPERAKDIFKRLESKGFASSNVVFGVGSYSLGYHTRDTFGFALKATHTIQNGKEIMIFKDPKTDSGMKKSARGMCAVVNSPVTETLGLIDGLTSVTESRIENNMLQTVFIDGKYIG